MCLNRVNLHEGFALCFPRLRAGMDEQTRKVLLDLQKNMEFLQKSMGSSGDAAQRSPELG